MHIMEISHVVGFNPTTVGITTVILAFSTEWQYCFFCPDFSHLKKPGLTLICSYDYTAVSLNWDFDDNGFKIRRTRVCVNHIYVIFYH